MERKGNRNSSVARNAAVDSKKDGVNTRQWPRGCRRREPAGGINSEPSRKPQPQRVKTIDKRPKPRGGGNSGGPTNQNVYQNGLLVGNETTWLDPEQHAEFGSVFLPGSKKQSLNHLLNFSYYSPRDRRGDQLEVRGGVGRDSKGGSRAKLLGTKKHKYNKEHFLQANCQFIVNEFGDYKQYLNNPDALVDWDYIEQVNLQVSESPSCPICLYPPVAAKMTRCGHIYCWPCILHYLSLSDKPSRNCPICFVSINKNDLKSVIAITHPTFNVAESITFKLMKRLRGSLIAYPADAEVVEDDVVFEMSKIGQIYSKLLLAKKLDVLSIIEREEKELCDQILAEDEDCPEKCFIEQALELLKEREVKVVERNEKQRSEKNKEKSDALVEDVEEEGLDGSGTSSLPSKYHYFYQASDGQHIYLHALNARMLEYSYGSLENGPKTITGIILEKEGGSMTEELRKRLRYLQHLPVTCQFEVAEIQLKQPLVNKETLEHFKDQIEIRKKRRQRRAKEEKRREKRIEAEENWKMGKYPVPELHLESNIQFPEFGTEQRFRTESESTLPSERSCSPDLATSAASTSLENTYAGPSFAKMLATEKKQVPSWPSLKTAPTVTPQKLITVTGSNMKNNVIKPPKNEDDFELEDYEPVPSLNRSLGDALALALAQVEIDEEKEDREEEEARLSGKKKKYLSKMKKKSKKVLFATTIAYSGN